MDHKQLKQLDRSCVMQTYGRFDVDIDHGSGATLYDLAGNEYIDFTSGIGVCSVGYANPKWLEAITAQAAKLGHISNLFYSQPCAELAQKLCERSGMACAFFANSGAESNEGVIKLARKYSFDKYGKGRGTVLTLKNSFHGRTLATLTATGQDVFHNYFFPFPDGFRYAEAGSIDSVNAAAGHDVCAVLLELVQGEGGVLPMDRAFVHDLAVLCAERDWLLLVDEVQTGVGRTGTLFAFQQYGILPDAVSFACAVLDQLDEDTLASVREKGAYIRRRIEEMRLPCLGATRGLGLMIGIEVKGRRSNKELADLLIHSGLLVLTAGPALRLLPPLTITMEEIDRGLTILQDTLKEEA